MNYLEKINIQNFRCFEKKEFYLSNQLNIIKGKNGSGKTSILEAINVNLYGKSFKTKNLNSVINNKAEFLRLEGLVKNFDIYEKIVFFRKKNSKLKGINHILYKDKKSNVGEIAKILPVQIINQDIFFILNGIPNNRRKFLDWGVFHVEHNYYNEWKNYSILLRQRNFILKKTKIDEQLLSVIEQQLINSAKKINLARKKYLEIYNKKINEKIKDWNILKNLEIKYYCGWDEKKEFEEILKKNKIKDHEMGITNNGPHRCDLEFEINKIKATEILSRGQQKILLIILKILQGDFLEKITNKKCIYLIDDLYSELDKDNYKKIIDKILNLNNQVVLTTKDKFEFKKNGINEINL